MGKITVLLVISLVAAACAPSQGADITAADKVCTSDGHRDYCKDLEGHLVGGQELSIND